MAMNGYRTTRGDIVAARDALQRMRARAARDEAKASSAKSMLARAAGASTGAFASAFLQSRFGVTGIGPVPVDLIGAGGLLALARYAFPRGGALADGIEAAGDGVLALFFGKLGAGLGANMRAATPASAPATSGVGNWDVMPGGYGGYPVPAMGVPYAGYGVPAWDMQAVAGVG
jgi:hypothetical protein